MSRSSGAESRIIVQLPVPELLGIDLLPLCGLALVTQLRISHHIKSDGSFTAQNKDASGVNDQAS